MTDSSLSCPGTTLPLSGSPNAPPPGRDLTEVESDRVCLVAGLFPERNVLKFIPVAGRGRLPPLLKVEPYFVAWMDHASFIRPSVHGRLGCSHLLPIVDNADVNTSVQMSVRVSALSSEVELLGRVVILFSTF